MKLKSFVLVEENENYLLICEASKKWKGKWFFPGGAMKRNETPAAAAVRETKEEAKCDVVLAGIFYYDFHPGFVNGKLQLYYHGKSINSTLKNFADKHSLAAKWFTYKEILLLPLRQNALEIIDVYRDWKKQLMA